ncbi:MAG TPA: hypothetical protein VH186_21010 [Chloroflexia bacterium]|nr:hypothetical protein [Chloroflexia bacterium]
MLIPWQDIFPVAGLAGVITLALLGVYRLVKKELNLAYSLGLALVCGFGFLLWFALFNGFSLGVLNQDWPIPLFPVSPEDIGCGITVLVLTLLYGLSVAALNRNRRATNSSLAFGVVAWLLPALVALVIDVYLI